MEIVWLHMCLFEKLAWISDQTVIVDDKYMQFDFPAQHTELVIKIWQSYVCYVGKWHEFNEYF